MTYSPSRTVSTIQEWEMANDLGDSHINSLRQGGSLPANSTAERIAGRIYAMAGTAVKVLVYPELNGRTQTAMIYNTSNAVVSQITGSSSNTAPLTLNFTPSASGWYSIRVKNGASNTSAMKVWVNVTYTAPPMVDTRNSPGNLREAVLELEDEATTFTASKESFASVYPNPAQAEVNFEFSGVPAEELIEFRLLDLQGREILRQESEQAFISRNFNEGFSQLRKGAYVLSLRSASLNQQIRLLKAD
jgi:alpha-amylase